MRPLLLSLYSARVAYYVEDIHLLKITSKHYRTYLYTKTWKNSRKTMRREHQKPKKVKKDDFLRKNRTPKEIPQKHVLRKQVKVG